MSDLSRLTEATSKADRRARIQQQAINRRISWFIHRRDYWLSIGDMDRAEVLDGWAVAELALWRKVNPIATLIEDI